jgi:hypothetical protein
MSDFDSSWYKKWAKELKQDKDHLQDHQIRANKFWQNAALTEALYEQGVLEAGKSGIGFGVGQERLPALFAKYGVNVTATDQDFTTQKAGHWAKHELATSAQSLNKLGICPEDDFAAHVSYSPVDMKKVPKKFFDGFDFAWSNCALGHLGSLEAGLKFIEESLLCVKPGGTVVHTTEFNVLSNVTTSTGGDTVIFRAKDINRLYKKLTSLGYDCSPVYFTFGTDPVDARVSMRPQYGNDFSKIQVNGHIATQALLIIRRPLQPVNKVKKHAQLTSAYLRNLKTLALYKNQNKQLSEALKSQKSNLAKIRITPQQKEVKVSLKKGTEKKVVLAFKNSSEVPLFGLYARLANSKPVVLGTSGPKDRDSAFSDTSWPGESKNRAAYDLRKADGETLADYIKPKEDFCFTFTLNTKNVKQGVYKESFCIVQESVGWVDESEITLNIRVS